MIVDNDTIYCRDPKREMQVTFNVSDFDSEVIKKSRDIPILADFWAEWCGPCKVLGPVLEGLAHDSGGRWVLAKVNIEIHPTISTQYNVRSIPNVKLFVDENIVDEFSGALPESQIVAWLKKVVPSNYQPQIENARQLLLVNDPCNARRILLQVLKTEPENEEAVVLLAQTYLNSDIETALGTVQPIQLGSKYYSTAEAIRTLAFTSRRIATEISVPGDSMRSLYQESITNALTNNFDLALEGLVEIVGQSRTYDNEGARKACIAIFNLLGDDHKITKHYRSALSRILF